jgi:hypothetical protein
MDGNDLTRRGLRDGEPVMVSSRRGRFVALAHASDEVRSGQAFLPMHWGDAFVRGEGLAGMNALTLPAFDPVSKQPELKHAAVRVSRIEAGWELLAMARLPRASLEDRACSVAGGLRALRGGLGGAHGRRCSRTQPARFAREPASRCGWPTSIADADGCRCDAYDDLAGRHGRGFGCRAMLWTARLSGRIAGTPAAAGCRPAPVRWLRPDDRRGAGAAACRAGCCRRFPPQSAFAPRTRSCASAMASGRAIDAALVEGGAAARNGWPPYNRPFAAAPPAAHGPQLRACAQAIAASRLTPAASAAAVAP